MNFMPHGHCYYWMPEILLPMVAGDLMHMVAYYGLAGMLFYLCTRPMGNVSSWMPPFIFLFACFIFTCALTHTLGLITIWYPVYYIESAVSLLSGTVSMLTLALTIMRRKEILEWIGAGPSSLFPSNDYTDTGNHPSKKDCDKCMSVLVDHRNKERGRGD